MASTVFGSFVLVLIAFTLSFFMLRERTVTGKLVQVQAAAGRFSVLTPEGHVLQFKVNPGTLYSGNLSFSGLRPEQAVTVTYWPDGAYFSAREVYR